MRRVIVLGALACAASLGMPAATQAAGTGAPWIHVRVEDGKASKVAVNVPLAVAQAVLAAAPRDLVVKGKVGIGRCGHRVSVASLRKAWAELRKAGDTELVSVEDDDQTVKIAREGDRVHIRVTSTGKGDNVKVEVPVAAVDALLAGEGDELDLAGALTEIEKIKGDVVQVDDGESKVRIWIDEEI